MSAMSLIAGKLAGMALSVVLGLSTGGAPVGVITNFGPNLQQAAGGVCRQPEGLAADPRGNLYVASNSDSATTVGYICVINPAGQITDTIPVPAGAVPAVGLLGELWERGQLYVLDQADDVSPHGRLLRIDPVTHTVTTVATGFTFPNGVVEDRQGNLYISDSFEGRVYRLTPGGVPTVWAADPSLISTNPAQPVGVNGIEFDRGGHYLYVANTGNRQVLRIPVKADGSAGPIQLFADGAVIDRSLGLAGPVALYGADGIQFDVKGNLYVMANQADEVQVLAPDGALVHRYSGTGSNALDFNASPVFVGDMLYMTNMSAADGGINSKVSVMRAPYRGFVEP
jgi:sugar lactone lactonase YvrE